MPNEGARINSKIFARLKQCQKPLDILSFGILSATGYRSMNYWSSHAQQDEIRHTMLVGVIVSLGVASYRSASAKEPEHRHEKELMRCKKF